MTNSLLTHQNSTKQGFKCSLIVIKVCVTVYEDLCDCLNNTMLTENVS